MRKNEEWKKFFSFSGIVIAVSFLGVSLLARIKRKSSIYEDEPNQINPFEGKKVIFVNDESDNENADGVRGHLEAIGESEHVPGIYEKYIKRGIDIILSFGGMVALSPILLSISIAIMIDDPGPVLFTQKRLGQNKKFFKLHKFRSMKMSTPHDVPTHMLENPDQYITNVGRFLRAHSLDELPQIWDIFVGNMSVIGPRPGLWNQDVLTAERDKYSVNDVKPGLTGWAQINGRDELEIADKAALDGEYVKKIGMLMDVKCFLGSLGVFAKDDSVVEGGTGEIKKSKVELLNHDYIKGKSNEELIGKIGFNEKVEVDLNQHKKVLVTGAGSYIGEAFKEYAKAMYPMLSVDTLDLLDETWSHYDFSGYDIVFHVAGLAHADVGKVDEEVQKKYYAVNTELTIRVCNIAKQSGVKEFIFMSSMIVYGDSAPYGKKKVIDKNTVPHTSNFYGDSKLQADVAIRSVATDSFKVIVLRPPMIYGRGSKGNYPLLAKGAKILPVFPNVKNERSMLYIENLCEFLCQVMLISNINQNSVVLIPQNSDWMNTSQMVKWIANANKKKVFLLKALNPAVVLGGKIPGKIGGMINKAFGNYCYDVEMSAYPGINYQIMSNEESINCTERDYSVQNEEKMMHNNSVLMLASVASMIDQFNLNNIEILLKLGYKVDVACNFEKGSTCTDEKIEALKKHLDELGIRYYQIDFTRSVLNIWQNIKAYSQVKKIADMNHYSFIHCHSPIGGVIGRIAGHNSKTKVMYTAHGFHFYKGAPFKNWMLFYPIEKFLSRWTECLITINQEDYSLAKTKFHAAKTLYVPGIGIDMDKFSTGLIDTDNKRKELGVSVEEIMLLSVGELSERKNHEVVIDALAEMKDISFKYFIVGKGDLKEHLERKIQMLGLHNKVQLLGFRTDVSELCQTADVFIFPSHQEGLPVALMEAIACKSAVVASDIRGNIDLVENRKYLFNENSVDDVKSKLLNIISVDKRERIKVNCSAQIDFMYENLEKYSLTNVNREMEQIYDTICH